MPLFDREVADQIAHDYTAQQQEGLVFKAWYDVEHDAFVIYDPFSEITEIYPAVGEESEDGQVRLYALGHGSWTWEEVT